MGLGWKDKNDNLFRKCARTSNIHSLLLPILQHQGRHSDIQPGNGFMLGTIQPRAGENNPYSGESTHYTI